tara:strand:- start:66 stop:689 length:624 start_codon:yes stop_codon:yes gene_type:complete
MNEMIILVSGLFFMYYIDIKYVLMIMVFVYILNDYTNIKTKFMKTINVDKQEASEYNSIVEDIIGSFKKYSKKSKKQYKQGLYYWKKFIKTLKILEDKSLQNYNHYFDRAFDYLKQSVNHFQSISISIKERELLDGIKFNDYTNAKNTKEVSDLSKSLYKEGYLLLYNLSLELNERWLKNPNINNKQIILDHPLAFNDQNSSFDFYI